MEQQDVLKFVYFITLFGLLVNSVLCMRHPRYIEHDLESMKDCHLIGHKKLNKDLAVIVKINLTISSDIECKFTIKANKRDGLFGVIQKMSFRTNGTSCLDYVQFKRGDETKTEKFCGRIDHSKTKYYPVPEPTDDSDDSDDLDESGPPRVKNHYAEYDISEDGGKLETLVHIARKEFLPRSFLELVIVYTPYKKCTSVNITKYKDVGFKSCVAKDYFCDGFQNCVPSICNDEENCPNVIDVISNGTGTKVTVGAVTTIILCIILFVACIWACKKHNMLFWSSDCAGPSGHTTVPGSQAQESEGTNNLPVPTAPMLEVVVTPPVLDKDLPPSYDSLFPAQSNPTT